MRTMTGEGWMSGMTGMCERMMGSDRTDAPTKELQTLFNEWLEQMEGEALRHVQEMKEFSLKECAAKLHVSEESARSIIDRLIAKGKLSARYRSDASNRKGDRND